MLPRPTAKPTQDRRKSSLPVHVPRLSFPFWDRLELELMLESEPDTVGRPTSAPFSTCNHHTKNSAAEAKIHYQTLGQTHTHHTTHTPHHTPKPTLLLCSEQQRAPVKFDPLSDTVVRQWDTHSCYGSRQTLTDLIVGQCVVSEEKSAC